MLRHRDGRIHRPAISVAVLARIELHMPLEHVGDSRGEEGRNSLVPFEQLLVFGFRRLIPRLLKLLTRVCGRTVPGRVCNVLRQGVRKGTELEPGSSVTLVVAAPYPRVPSVVGKSEASAIRKLKDAGFKVRKTTQTRTTGRDEVVLGQSLSGGTRAGHQRPHSGGTV
jgi:hypothetical protein